MPSLRMAVTTEPLVVVQFIVFDREARVLFFKISTPRRSLGTDLISLCLRPLKPEIKPGGPNRGIGGTAGS